MLLLIAVLCIARGIGGTGFVLAVVCLAVDHQLINPFFFIMIAYSYSVRKRHKDTDNFPLTVGTP
jgi:hypothetical protein